MSAGTGTVELKPCPFCGSQPELMEGHRNHWRVECPRCGVRRATFANGGVEEDKARAIRSWNRRSRPQPTPAGEIVERAKMVALRCSSLAAKTPVAGEPDPDWWGRQSALGDACDKIHELAIAFEQQAATIAERDARIEALEKALEKALERAIEAMTCGSKDGACYCPNCDSSFYGARDEARATLERRGQ